MHLDLDGICLRVAREMVPFQEGTGLIINEEGELDARNTLMSFTRLSGSFEEQIQQMLENRINSMVASHGGVVSLHAVEKTNVTFSSAGAARDVG